MAWWSQAFAPGQTLSVVASGGAVPAFGPASIVAPALPTLLAPVLSAPNGAESLSYVLPTTTDLAVSWSGSTPGARILFWLSPGGALAANDMYTCEWPASDGQGTVPQSILAALATESPDGGYVTFGQYATTTFTVGEYSITETALQDISGPVNYVTQDNP